MRKGLHFELRDINVGWIASGEYLDSQRVIITKDRRSDEELSDEYDTLREVREEYDEEGAYCIHIPKQKSVEDHTDKDYNIVIPTDIIEHFNKDEDDNDDAK